MSVAGNMNGVTRCIDVLMDAFSKDLSFNPTWLRFMPMDDAKMVIKRARGIRIILFPLPKDIFHFLNDDEKRKEYWNYAYSLLSTYISEYTILHIHTLNLAEFALIVKQKVRCWIVTHVHCIPWKGIYNHNIKRFNQLYYQYYVEKKTNIPGNYIIHKYEELAYTQSDILICVTECARNFICKQYDYISDKIVVLTNGIQNWAKERKYNKKTKGIKCIFVGDAHPSKGIDFVIDAMQAILVRYPASLTIVGKLPKEKRKEIQNKHPFLDLKFTGQVGITRLRELYAESDIGLIGSIQEQCSYVAIEMMMSGLPIITADADGLDELFTDGINAVKVPVIFHPQYGLSVDTIKMADDIVRLGESPKIREKLGENARKQYLHRHTQEKMFRKLIRIYDTLS